MKIRFISLSALCCAALLILTGCGKKDDGKIRIGVSIPSADHGWTGGVVYWAEQTKKDFERKDPRIEIILSTARDSSEQVNKIENLMVQGIKALVVLPAVDSMVIKSLANIPGVVTTQYNTVNVYDVLNADKFIIAKEAVEKLEEVYVS